VIKRSKSASSGKRVETWMETRSTQERHWFELFDQVADRCRTLWSIISTMQIRDSLHRCSHCALLFSPSFALVNEWIRDLEYQSISGRQPAVQNVTLQGVARFAARPAGQSRHPRAGSDGRTNPLGHRRLCTDSPSRAASHTRLRDDRLAVGQFVSTASERSRGGPISRSGHVLM
jgi:hypothetical protein